MSWNNFPSTCLLSRFANDSVLPEGEEKQDKSRRWYWLGHGLRESIERVEVAEKAEKEGPERTDGENGG